MCSERTWFRAPVLACLCLFAFAVRGAAQLDNGLRIGTITIENVDIYTPDEARRGELYRMADRLHIQTRTSVIRGFLLFKEGDPYDPAILAETERNLRALGFLKSADVIGSAPHDGVVDVTVRTQDTWSLEPGSDFGSKGGAGNFGLSLTDNNVAGLGRQISLSYRKGPIRNRAAIEYRDAAFFRPYWRARFLLARNSDGFEHRIRIERPFFSSTARWSTRFSLDEVRQGDRLFSSGLLNHAFSQLHRESMASAGFAIRATELDALRLTGGIRSVQDRFATLRSRGEDPLPPGREFHYLFLRLDRIHNDYVKVHFVNKDLRYEDFNLGPQFSIEAAVSPRITGSPATTGLIRLSGAAGHAFDDGTFLLPAMTFESRIDHGFRNAILSATTCYVHRFDTSLPQTFVGRVLLNSGWRLDPEVQFFADGATGLRGYRLYSFEGRRNLIVNLEQRWFLGRELLQLMSPGLVAFVDTGTATNNSFLRSGLKTDVGVGIRIGLPRAPKNLLRIDFAYALNRDAFGRRGFLVAFSSGQAF